MEEEEVVSLKIFDEERGDVVFEGKVSTDVEPHELVKLRCFWERSLYVIINKATKKQVESFKGLQNNVELVARDGDYKYFSGVLYVGADDGVMRKSKSVQSCEYVKMTMWKLSHEECEKVFKCEMLEDLEMIGGELRQIPSEVGKMKKLKKLRLHRLRELKSIPEEFGELSSLKELRILWCGVESLSKRLKELKTLRMVSLESLHYLQLNADDLAVFSKLKHLTIRWCRNAFSPSFTQLFWEMIKSTTDLRVVELEWYLYDEEMVVAAMEENGSIVDGGKSSRSYAHIFKRNKANHERALQCVVQLLAIRRWRNGLHVFPKEMVRMLATMLWNTKCDVGAWRISDNPAMKEARSE